MRARSGRGMDGRGMGGAAEVLAVAGGPQSETGHRPRPKIALKRGSSGVRRGASVCAAPALPLAPLCAACHAAACLSCRHAVGSLPRN